MPLMFAFSEMVTIMVALVIVVILIVFSIRIVKGAWGTGGGQAEETQLIQEIHEGLKRMEERVDALETILISQERQRKNREE